MASALDKLASGKETQKKFSDINKDSLYINTDDLFSSGNKFSFDEGTSAQETQTDERTYKNALDRLTEESNIYLDDEQYEESTTFAEGAMDVIKDIAVQPFGGIVDAAESIVNLALPEEREIEISDWIPESKTVVGRFVRPASQFFIPYTGAYKIAKGGFLFIKNAGRLKKFVSTAKERGDAVFKSTIKGKKTFSQGSGKTVAFKPLEKLTNKQAFSFGITAGALTDGIAFAPTDGNLADLFVQYPATKNIVTEWLQTDPNGDPGMERLKNALTGIVPGIVIPTVIRGVAKGFSWTSKPARSKISKTNDDVQIREEFEVNLKKAKLGDDLDTSAIRKLVAKKRTRFERVSMLFREENATKRRVIKYLDGVRGIKYLMDAATKLGVKGLTGRNNIGAYKENRFLPAVGGMVEHFLLKNTFKFKNGLLQTTHNDGLQNLLLKNLGKNADVDKFFDYMGAKSLLSISNDKFAYNPVTKKGLFKDAAKARKEFLKIAKQGDAKEEYVKTLKEMDRFNSELLDFAVDTQMITATQKALFLKNRKHFLPLYRDLSDTELLLKRVGGGNKLRVSFTASVPVGTGKGELPFSNFFDNYVENVQSIISTGYKNHAKRSTFDIIDAAKAQGKGLDAWAKKLEGKDAHKLKKITVKPEELKTILNKSKIDFDPNQLDDIDDLALFRSERIDVGDNEYVFRTVIKDGVEITRRDVYQINDDLLKLTLDHISPKQYYATLAAVKVAQWAKGLLTRMVTLDPGFFAGANALRDTFSAAILSSNPWHVPIISTIVQQIKRFANTKAIKMADGSSMSTKELYEEFLLNGGSFGSTLLGGEISEGVLKTLYRKMGHSDYSTVLNTPKKLYDNYESVVTGFENSSRFTEYALMRKSINPATGVRFTAREAAYNAREVAVDFGMHGANYVFRQYVSTVPFLNAGLQGIYRTVRALGPGSHQKAAVVSKLIAYVGVPTALLYTMNRKNPEYWNQSQQIRDTNYLISLGKGKGWLKIPKPFEFGAFGTVAESLLAEGDSYLFKNNTAKADSFFDTLWVVTKDQLRLSYMPQVVSPIWKTYLNETFFGSPIIPEGMKHTIPDYGQSYPWSNRVITAAIERAPHWLRDKLMSPIEFENYIRAYTGTMGGYALDLLDESSDLFSDVKKPDKRFDEWPFFKRFLQLDPAKYTRAEAEFYELKDRASKAINQFRKFKNEFKIELLEDFMKDPENMELLQLNGRFELWGKRISKINKRRNQIYNTSEMSGAKKRAQLDMLEKQAGKIFELIMNELEGKNLDVLDNTVFN